MGSVRLLSFPTRALPMLVSHGRCTNVAITGLHGLPIVRNIDVGDVGHTNVGVPILTTAAVSPNSVLRLINAGLRIGTTTSALNCTSHPAGRASVVFINLKVFLKNIIKTLAVRFKNIPVDLDADNKTLVTKLIFN